MASHALLISGKAKAFFRCCLDIDPADIYVQRTCDILLHSFNIGSQLRSLGDHGHIDIADPITGFPYPLSHNPQQHQRIRSLIGGIRIREVFSDISQSCSAQQRIGNRVKQHIRIAVTKQSPFIFDLYAARIRSLPSTRRCTS